MLRQPILFVSPSKKNSNELTMKMKDFSMMILEVEEQHRE